MPMFAALSAARLAGPLIAGAVAFGAGFAAAELYEHKAPWGLDAKRDRAEARADGWRWGFDHEADRALAWARSFGKAEGLRRVEGRRASSAVTAVEARCDARLAAAWKSAAAIHALVNKEPPRDPQGCPVRQLVDPRQLRDALVPPAR